MRGTVPEKSRELFYRYFKIPFCKRIHYSVSVTIKNIFIANCNPMGGSYQGTLFLATAYLTVDDH